MDIVPGANRRPGDFTWGTYGWRSWVFYMQGYRGFLSDVVTLGHEAAHAVHYSLIGQAGVQYFVADGPGFITEGFAKVNELLVLDHLASQATGEDRLIYLREAASKLCSVKFTAMYWAAYATCFEIETYRRMADGRIGKAEQIHAVWEEFGGVWSSGFDTFPDKRFLWGAVPHFFNAPLYYANYLFAWVLAVSVYDRLKSEAGFAQKFVGLMKFGFREEPLVMLKSQLGIDLCEPATLQQVFQAVEDKLAAFEHALGAM